MNIILHDLTDPHKEIELDAMRIVDMNWATNIGGTNLSLDHGIAVTVDENPNHVALIAGMISGEHCAVGSHSGRYHWGM